MTSSVSTTTPKVSVIVTVYNDEKYLERCLDALLNQTLTDIEIICIEDCSTDQSRTILEKYHQQDSRIKLLLNTENVGVSASRNRGIKAAQANYIMFCDGDDYYELDACAAMYETITRRNIDLVISEINVIYHAHPEMKISDDNYYSLKHSGLYLVDDNLIFFTDLAPTNKIFKRQLIEEHQISFPEGLRFEDAYFCVAYFCVSNTVYYLNQRLYNYIRHANSAMSQTWSTDSQQDIAIDHLYIAFRLYDFLVQQNLLEKYNSLFWRFFESFERFAIDNSKTRARRREVKQEAENFVKAHQTSFDGATTSVRESIQRLSSPLFLLNTTQLKLLLLRFMPTYRLQIANIHRIRALSAKNQQLLDRASLMQNFNSQNTQNSNQPVQTVPTDSGE